MKKTTHCFNKKLFIAFICLTAALLLFTGCRNSTSDESSAAASAVDSIAESVAESIADSADESVFGKQITVQVVHRDGSSKDFKLNTQEEFLGAALVAEEVVVNNRSTYGLFIVTADGETADDANQEWWKITKNGEMLMTGADDTAIADGDHFELTLTVGYDN